MLLADFRSSHSIKVTAVNSGSGRAEAFFPAEMPANGRQLLEFFSTLCAPFLPAPWDSHCSLEIFLNFLPLYALICLQGFVYRLGGNATPSVRSVFFKPPPPPPAFLILLLSDYAPHLLFEAAN